MKKSELRVPETIRHNIFNDNMIGIIPRHDNQGENQISYKYVAARNIQLKIKPKVLYIGMKCEGHYKVSLCLAAQEIGCDIKKMVFSNGVFRTVNIKWHDVLAAVPRMSTDGGHGQ